MRATDESRGSSVWASSRLEMELLALAVLLNAATGWMVLGPRDGAMAARLPAE